MIGVPVLVVLATACIGRQPSGPAAGPSPPRSSSTPPSDHAGWNSYGKPPIRFAYPDQWHAQRFEFFSEFSSPLVYLSNQPMGQLCFHPQPGTRSCRTWPIPALPEGGVVLRWTANGFPGWHFSHAKGTETTIDGHRAKVAIGGSSSLCQQVGGTPMTVTVERPGITDNWYELDACFNDSSTTDFQSEISTMIGTVHISGH
jgi:hypothetical protein